MNGCEHGCTNQQSRGIGEVIIVEGSQQIEVDFVVVEDVGIEADEPDEVDEVEQTAPDGEGAFEVIVGGEVDFEIDNYEDDSNDDENDSGKPETE